jgi:hypothetical protein
MSTDADYTPEVLAVVCPECCAAVTGKCLERTLWGKRYRESPHAERVAAARDWPQALRGKSVRPLNPDEPLIVYGDPNQPLEGDDENVGQERADQGKNG